MIVFEGECDIVKREIEDFGEYYEIDWWLNESPCSEWIKEFEKSIKPFFQKEYELFGPFKPKIINCILITTILDKNKIQKQKEFFENEFFKNVNKVFSK